MINILKARGMREMFTSSLILKYLRLHVSIDSMDHKESK